MHIALHANVKGDRREECTGHADGPYDDNVIVHNREYEERPRVNITWCIFLTGRTLICTGVREKGDVSKTLRKRGLRVMCLE